ncbi:class I SAM-dependent methyltransferase [Fundidesulfovibrio agrisoli]|uniref:class I SAM-dependent methyltransferase n=1 Tax=Fundidesulfovibrio agrisoli TaxID=2922717 RepID=UPI001FAE1BD3
MLTRDGRDFFGPDGSPVARLDRGVVRFGLPQDDASIDFFTSVGGTHFHERSQVPLAMTTLDTPVYHGYMARLREGAPQGAVVDVGGGDGRNTWPWLAWGHPRVVVVDPVFESLSRLRGRVAAHDPSWLERLLLVESDSRSLPLASGFADRLLSIEALAYLNEDYPLGLSECARVVKPGGKLLIADRDYEGGLVMQAFYFGGLKGLLNAAPTRDIWDGRPDFLVRNRSFTRSEFQDAITEQNLTVLFSGGISAMSLIISFLRSKGLQEDAAPAELDALRELLAKLGEAGSFRRSHVIIAQK